MLSDHYGKVWLIEYGAMYENGAIESVRGGICVHKSGVILTTCLGLRIENLRGRAYNGSNLFELSVKKKIKKLNLVFLKVDSKVNFPFFRLNEEINLNRGDFLRGIFHCGMTPYTLLEGHSCQEVKIKSIPLMPLDDPVDERVCGEYFSVKPLLNVRRYTGNEPNLEHFHPSLPIIQIYGIPHGKELCGGSVFNGKEDFLGLYSFGTRYYGYVIPTKFLKSVVEIHLPDILKDQSGTKRRAELATKTPEKKAKLVTQKFDGKKGGGHVATPHPSKSPKSGKYSCTSGEYSCVPCNKNFKSEVALSSHNMAKHRAG